MTTLIVSLVALAALLGLAWWLTHPAKPHVTPPAKDRVEALAEQVGVLVEPAAVAEPAPLPAWAAVTQPQLPVIQGGRLDGYEPAGTTYVHAACYVAAINGEPIEHDWCRQALAPFTPGELAEERAIRRAHRITEES